MKGAPTRGELLRLLKEAYAGPAWHGPSLKTAIRGLAAPAAARRAAPGRNTPWELVVHCAYSRHVMVGRLTGERGERFPHPVPRHWWPAPGGTSAAAWAADRRLLDETHERLLAVVASLPAARLAARRPGKKMTLGAEVAGVALHDVYHAGQIVLMRKLGTR